ncbi:ABC transporter substrate-binding protein [Bradyrhizobium vignae]|uniref:ABC transporter substrate-binding protein n=1 Tax=Bradyrhizobium vignae TaxID=1549949 RepID=UPI00100BD146|nr:ABC transporter substrate-binding protein [Bradyrhizobium vignae]RXG91867.1 hypothetical protein EAV90_27515 [Bradyrhizobium vignae]
MTLAIDRQTIINSIWRKRMSVPLSHQSPAYGALYHPDCPIPQYNPQGAKRLLAETSYNGAAIPFKTVGNYYTAELIETQAIAAMWRAVGLNVDFQMKENGPKSAPVWSAV